MSACTGTVSTIDNRTDTTGRHPVWQHIITYACVTADTTATISFPIEGVLQKIVYKRPDTTNNDLTSQLTIADAGDNTIFDSGSGLAENGTSTYNLTEPLTGVCDILITFNEAVGVTATFTVTLRGV
jgi:hypothetical protein